MDYEKQLTEIYCEVITKYKDENIEKVIDLIEELETELGKLWIKN